jgi:hypothetical protein
MGNPIASHTTAHLHPVRVRIWFMNRQGAGPDSATTIGRPWFAYFRGETQVSSGQLDPNGSIELDIVGEVFVTLLGTSYRVANHAPRHRAHGAAGQLERLVALGYHGPLAHCLWNFQAEEGLPATGKANEATIRRLSAKFV